jgi:hypothetical protein
MNTLRPKINFEEKTQYEKDYRDKNKNKIYDRYKEYYDQNKDKVIEYQKDYYTRNKDKKKDYLQEKHQCLCGGCFTTANRSAHFKTKKHLKYIQENESE